ncbi:MAG: outer membrane beta-barrel protein [Candidatus Aminicenantales bacterium]
MTRKKAILAVVSSLFLLTLLTTTASAQTSPIDKGSINIGGMLSFQSYSGDLYGDGMSTTLLMPGFRYFIMRGLAVGADLMLIRQSGDDWSDTTTGIGPTVAYFFNTKSDQFYPYVGLRLQYYCLSSSWNSHSDSMTGFDFGFGGGLAYMLKRNVAVTAEVGYHIQSLSYEGESESGSVLSFMVGLAVFLY